MQNMHNMHKICKICNFPKMAKITFLSISGHSEQSFGVFTEKNVFEDLRYKQYGGAQESQNCLILL